MQRTICLLMLVLLNCVFLCIDSFSLIMVSKGDAPFENPSVPHGAEAVANLPGRFGYMEGPPFGGGEYFFEYACKDTAQFNAALQTFSKIKSPRHKKEYMATFSSPRTVIVDEYNLLLVVHRKNATSSIDRKAKKKVDWSFTVWIPDNYYRLNANPSYGPLSGHSNFRQEIPYPRIDLYLNKENSIVWEQVKIPANIKVIIPVATEAKKTLGV